MTDFLRGLIPENPEDLPRYLEEMGQRLEESVNPDVGLWTPEYGGSDTDPSGITYGNQFGYFVREGNKCTVWGKLGTDLLTVGVGSLLITGFPFPCASVWQAGAVMITEKILGYNFLVAIDTMAIVQGERYALLLTPALAVVQADGTGLGAGANSNQIQFSFTYPIDISG